MFVNNIQMPWSSIVVYKDKLFTSQRKLSATIRKNIRSCMQDMYCLQCNKNWKLYHGNVPGSFFCVVWLQVAVKYTVIAILCRQQQ